MTSAPSLPSLPWSKPEITRALPGFYLTLREAAEQLGLSGRAGERRLCRLLRDREQVIGERILIVRRGSGRSRLLITLPLLEQHCPELFARRVQLSQELRGEIDRMDEQMAALRRQNLALAEEIARLAKGRSASEQNRSRSSR